MIIGDMILANEVVNSPNNQTVLNVPNNVFPVLSTPAFISFGVTLVISGMDLSTNHRLTVEVNALENEEEPRVIFQENISGNPHQIDPYPTLTANLSLRNIRVNNTGYHKVVAKLDNETVSESIINIIETE